MKLLFVTPSDLARPLGGRAMLSRLHATQLGEILGTGLVTHQLAPERGHWGGVGGQIDGATKANLSRILTAIDAAGIDTLWLDGSNLGWLARSVKRARPAVRVVTFFHNVEARFFWGSVRTRRSARSLAVLAANYVAERHAVRASDVLVALSDRDSAGLLRLYGRAADAVLPMMLEDTAPSSPPIASGPPSDSYVLFVGGGFYANIAGIRWFAREVAPRTDLDVKVVGRGMDELADEFATTRRVTLVGAVDDLAPCYAGALLVIAPIFDGSGMKTKVAEALMFGKHVVGTPEAFSGYAADVVAANWLCTDADAFAAAITAAIAGPPPERDRAMRALYERDHSPGAARARMTAILHETDQIRSS